MYQDSLLRFLDATKEWERNLVIEPNYFTLDLPGDIKNCFIISRDCNIDEMTCEDDEKYIFSTPDFKIRAKYDRFKTRILLQRFGPHFTQERIEYIIKAVWNYPQIAVNKLDAIYEPFFNKNSSSLPPMPHGGLPPRNIVWTDD